MKEEKLTEVFKITSNLAEKWADNAEANIQEKVDSFLDDAMDEFILRVCGFEVSWGSGRNKYKYWRIDHCNGRSGNSPIGDVINKAVAEKLASMMGAFDTVSASDMNDLKKEAHSEYIKQFKRQVSTMVRNRADKDAAEFVKKEVNNALEGSAKKVRLMLMESAK
ncbi:MAG: hypothetical protein ABFS03_00705 [Chloroflexota bacterium]